MKLNIFDNSVDGAILIANEIASFIKKKQEKQKAAVLGLATGSSPIEVYNELVRLHTEKGLSFENVISFNLDEYYGLKPESVQSYHRFMDEYLFNHVDINRDNIHIPDGQVPVEKMKSYCSEYDELIEKSGGIDIQLLGIGRTGHIGFNEPGSAIDSGTRLITLDKITRIDAAKDFYSQYKVPKQAITIGVRSIMQAKKVFLMAWGESKAEIMRKAIEEPVTELVPASFLQQHSNIHYMMDTAAASELERVKTPWLVGPVKWDTKQVRKAVVWLCNKVNKPVLKLTNEDYNEYGMNELLTERNSSYDININVFNQLQHTITGWPGGKPNADDSHRPERSKPYPKRVLIFSPHPDDDVISMGGTLLRLVKQQHEVHVAYQVSGNIAVFDDYAFNYLDLAVDINTHFGDRHSKLQQLQNEVKKLMNGDKVDDKIINQFRKIKGLIRKNEAKAACRYCGVKKTNVHFLDLPFYETGERKKKSLGKEDIRITLELIQQIKPHQIFVAGDLSDPHGTHRVCFEVVKKALDKLKEEIWMSQCRVWMYRGAWQEWDVGDIEMAVPISPGELIAKRKAIFKHQSQKDGVLFPGNDSREFWQRAEDRNRTTAQIYDKLGMAEYEAMEAFVEFKVY